MRELQSTQILLNKTLSQAGDAKRVRNVHVAIGEISELDQTLIQKHWQELGQGTPAEHAQLHFRLIKADVQCMACFSKYHPVNGKIHCPHCGSYGAKVLSGEEFYLETIELDDD
ncbi:MAG TPA: hydrogenase maturation nickel metallochaperone HypA [Anaerolineales bacterium]|nr:hydrogenase maturation nickel metallochaperone HypA [Anaerolineales bacterium]